MNTKTSSSKNNPSNAIALAVCNYALSSGGEIQLLPAGEFHAVDGRPNDAPCWLTNADIAAKLIADVAARANPLVVDYEHQTLLAAENGQPAPAAGWFKALRWEDGVGLFATVEWTERAIAHIEAGEYRFISPVIAYDKATGAIKKLINAALTNNPAIDGMAEVVARLTVELNPQENLSMELEELLKQLRWMLNLPTLATPEEVVAELQKGIDLIKQGDGEAIAANTLGIVGLTQVRAADITALTAKLDTATAALAASQTELAALKAEKAESEITGMVEAALTDGRLLPAQKEAAIELGRANLAALSKMIAGATPLAALTSSQTGGKSPAEGQVDKDSADSIAAAARKYQEDEAAAGRVVNSAQAVQFVMAHR